MAHRLACIFAHPDDETFCAAGTILKCGELGIRADLYCATDGDAGKNSAVPVSSRDELAAIRRAELSEAARILGIASVDRGGFGDGTLNVIDPTDLIGDIV